MRGAQPSCICFAFVSSARSTLEVCSVKSPEAELPNPGKLLYRCVRVLTEDADKLIFVAGQQFV